MTAEQQSVGEWLERQGLGRFASLFAEQYIDWEVLPTLSDQDLAQLGLSLGHRRKLLRAIADLSHSAVTAPAEPPPGRERRHMTMLFADIVGSTQLSTQLDPEDLAPVLQSFMREAGAAVLRWGGFVAGHMGDGMLAYFGWPSAAEDDAERAVRAGLAIVHATRQLGAGPDKLQVRVGIETGLVVIGALIGEDSSDLSVVGKAANLAARLQTIAEPNQVVVGPGTQPRLGAIFDLSPPELSELKGFEAPVAVWRVLGESRAAIRFAHRDALSGMVDRHSEMADLSEAWLAAQQGRGRAVLLSGEGGIGKSRIVAALAQGLDGTPHNRLFYQCSAVHAASVLHPVLRELERSAGLDPGDPPQASFARLERLFDWSGSFSPDALALVADWMGIAASTERAQRALEPQQRKALVFALLLERIARLAREQPLLLLLEDAHWSDATTLELFHQLLQGIAHMPLLSIITSRPESVAAWQTVPAVTVRHVTRLAPADVAAMIEHVAGSATLPERVVSQVQERTDGVPLFVEELTKAMVEAAIADRGGADRQRGPLRPTDPVPATLQDSLMGRLDRLGWAKEVAQTSAVLGAEFSYELLSLVSDMASDRLEQGLSRLMEAEFLVRHGSGSSASYLFRHALVQEAAHGSLLLSRRRLLHGRVAAVIQDNYPQLAETEPEVVAHHLTEAQLLGEAIGWWRKAGYRCVRTSSNREAIEHFTRALELLRRLPDGAERAQQELEIRTDLGVPLMGAAGYMAPEFSENFTRALELGRERDDTTKLFPALWAQWTATYSSGEMASAEVMSLNFLQGAERQGSRPLSVIGHRIHGITKLARGELQEARRELELSLSLYRDPEDNDLTYIYAQNQRIAALSYLCVAMHQLGHLDQALALSHQALAGAAELGHFNTRGYALAQVLRLHMMRRDFDALRDTAQALVEQSERHGASSWSLVARIALALCEANASPQLPPPLTIRTGIEELQARRWNFWVPWLLLEEIRLLLARRDDETAKRLLDEAEQLIVAQDHRLCEPDLHMVRAELVRLQDGPGAAEQEYRRAIDVALAQAAMLPALRAATGLAGLAVASNDGRDRAMAQLSQIVERFSETLQSADLLAARQLLHSANRP